MNWPRPSSKTGLCALALSGFFCAAGMAPAADLQEIPLPMKTRVYLANIEERGLTLSNIGFPAVKNAIKSGDPARIRAFLAEGFTARVMSVDDGPERRQGTVSMKRFLAGDPAAPLRHLDADGFTRFLLDLKQRFAGELKLDWKLKNLSPVVRFEDSGPYTATGQMRFAGNTPAGQPLEIVFEIAYDLAPIPAPDEIAETPGWLRSFSVDSMTVGRAPHALLVDVATERGIRVSDFHDNWQEPVGRRIVTSGGLHLADVNDDGFLDVLVTDVKAPRLYLGSASGQFRDATRGSGLSPSRPLTQSVFGDFDNDGKRDLHITNGYVKDITNMDFVAYDMNQAMQVFNPRAREAAIVATYNALPPLDRANYLYRNEGKLRFRALAPAWGSSFSNGAAYGDLDLDGDLDLVVSNIDAPAFVLQNLTRENQPTSTNYLMLRLQGPPKNRAGMGCRITLNTRSGVQVQEQYLYRGYQSTVDEVMHFGLGTDTLVDRLEAVWPDGKWQRWENLSVNQTLILRHDAARPSPAPADPVRDLTAGSSPRFDAVPAASGLSFRHRENDYVDFNTQPLLLQQYSRYGPGIAVGDVDANGWDDVYIGGASGQSGQLFLQAADGTFTCERLQKV